MPMAMSNPNPGRFKGADLSSCLLILEFEWQDRDTFHRLISGANVMKKMNPVDPGETLFEKFLSPVSLNQNKESN